MIRRIRAFGAFWYDFIIGDDWQIAAGIVVALALTATLAHGDVAAWWIAPLSVAALLSVSLWRAARPRD